jgi:hypothetical protein
LIDHIVCHSKKCSEESVNTKRMCADSSLLF